VIASFVNIVDLRGAFIRVCKQWHAIGMVIAKGAVIAAQIHKFILEVIRNTRFNNAWNLMD